MELFIFTMKLINLTKTVFGIRSCFHIGKLEFIENCTAPMPSDITNPTKRDLLSKGPLYAVAGCIVSCMRTESMNLQEKNWWINIRSATFGLTEFLIYRFSSIYGLSDGFSSTGFFCYIFSWNESSNSIIWRSSYANVYTTLQSVFGCSCHSIYMLGDEFGNWEWFGLARKHS